MGDGVLSVSKTVYRRIQHRIDRIRVRPRTDRPAHDHAIDTINHERQIRLSCRNLKLRSISKPFFSHRARVDSSVVGSRAEGVRDLSTTGVPSFASDELA